MIGSVRYVCSEVDALISTPEYVSNKLIAARLNGIGFAALHKALLQSLAKLEAKR
jgi:hypothetical protein